MTKLKELLLGLWLLLQWQAVAERVGSLSLSGPLILYLGLFGLLAGLLLLTAYVPNAVLRWFYALILASAAFYLDTFQRITGAPMSYDGFITMLHSAADAGDAFAQHGRLMHPALAKSLLLFAGIAWAPRWTPPFARALWLSPLLGVALLSAILFSRGGEGATGLPSSFTPLAYSSIYLYETASGSAGPREEVRLRPASASPARDIVFIIDESVGANYLDINAAEGVRSGLAEARSGIDIRNYGYAASVATCSVGTNQTLRFGGTRGDYQRINAVMPSIWDYARKAGFATVYLDAQRTGGQFNNLMTTEELGSVDEFVQFDNVPVRDRDMAAADRLIQLLGNDRAEFILVNKVGAHFPVHDKYPDAFMRYRPALPRGSHEDVSDTGSRAGFGGSATDWVRYRNAYRNTLLWNVGAFFDRLLGRADLSRATLIYTSDHGQDLHEKGRAGVNTHCSSDPVQEEGLVPLVVIEGAAGKTLPWDTHLAANRNRVSHYQIFPTLLALMGYDERQVRPVYGDGLLGPSRDPHTFNTLFNARLGREPVWKKIDLGRISLPPASDAAPR